MPSRILFICKQRSSGYDLSDTKRKLSSGLLNSVSFVSEMLKINKVDCKVVDVVDNNCIDKEVTLYKPTHVIIEALWVIPTKFEVLIKLHPNVKWIARLHSDTPFLAGEGVAMNWLHLYTNYKNVSIACNNTRLQNELEYLLKQKVLYLPNFYNVNTQSNNTKKDKKEIHIGCFGAIRPLKNQLIQSIAAMKFASDINKKLVFHINGTRVEGKGESQLRNIQELFKLNKHGHRLIEHSWLTHSQFKEVVSSMDIVMQVSFSETYNIVTADAISSNVGVVTSDEITFVSSLFHANCTNSDDIVSKLKNAYYLGKIGGHYLNTVKLKFNSYLAERTWLKMFK